MTNSGSNLNGGNEGKNFQPERYIERRNGVAYLPLKWRLAWLRTEHPQAVVKTNLVSHKKGVAVFQAQIQLPEGGIATGWGARHDPQASEEIGASTEFNLHYLTEAENQALGRALAVLGYGIEYATDFDMPTDGEPIALRDDGVDAGEDEVGIEVPLMANPPAQPESDEEVEGVIAITAPQAQTRPEADKQAGPVQKEEQTEDEADEEDEAEEIEEAATPAPAPLRAVQEEPARFSTEPTPFRSPRQPAVAPNPPTPITSRPSAIRRPGPTQVEPPAPTPPTPITNVAVEERLKGLNDSQLVLAIKQIFHEARKLHNLNEDAVDRSSQKRYGVAVNALNFEQAQEYLERIRTAPRTPKK